MTSAINKPKTVDKYLAKTGMVVDQYFYWKN